MKKDLYRVKSKVWLYPGMAGWHFVGVDEAQSRTIKERYGKSRRGFGSIPVEVTLGSSVWETSIFPSKKDGVYILPLKQTIRRKEDIYAGDSISFSLRIR